MKPSEILSYKPIKETKEIYALIDMMEELGYYHVNYNANELIVLKYYVDEQVNHSGQVFQIFSVYYNDQPVMIRRHSGDGGENQYSIILNKLLYNEIINYLKSLQDNENDGVIVYDMDDDIPRLGTDGFYKLEDFYDPNCIPQYKKGDIVKALVFEDHLRDGYKGDKGKTFVTRCEIRKVNPFNPTNTYYLW